MASQTDARRVAGMKTALEILGYRTYHAFNFWDDTAEHTLMWNRAIDVKYHGKGTFGRHDWDEILAEYSVILHSM
jgi:hypothetical protein